MGARIDLTDGHAPMTVHGGRLKAIDFTTPIASAQVKTAVLFAGLQAEGVTTVAESGADAGPLRTCAAGVWRGARADGGRGCDRRRPETDGDRCDGAGGYVFGGVLSVRRAAVCGFESGAGCAGDESYAGCAAGCADGAGRRIKVLDVEEKHGELVGTIQVTARTTGWRSIDIIGRAGGAAD